MDLAVRFFLSAHEVEREHRVIVVILGPDGQELSRLQAGVAAVPREQREQLLQAGRKLAVAIIVTFAHMAFREYGPHSLVITWDGTEMREPVRLYTAPLPMAPPA